MSQQPQSEQTGDTPADLLRLVRNVVQLDQAAGVLDMPLPKEPAEAEPAAPSPAAAQPAAAAQQPTPQPEPQRAAVPSIDASLDGAAQLAAIAQHISACERCGLCQTRANTVPGEGSAQAELVFIGDGPGAEEDASGRPFVGPAGQLLDKMIGAMGLEKRIIGTVRGIVNSDARTIRFLPETRVNVFNQPFGSIFRPV